jgi:hypothetical protein
MACCLRGFAASIGPVLDRVRAVRAVRATQVDAAEGAAPPLDSPTALISARGLRGATRRPRAEPAPDSIRGRGPSSQSGALNGVDAPPISPRHVPRDWLLLCFHPAARRRAAVRLKLRCTASASHQDSGVRLLCRTPA